MTNQLFWLHIKKSAGITTRNLLKPYYVMGKNRGNKPKNFIQAPVNEYNDILNNFRIVLGEYQFKRCLFAKKFLYPRAWDDVYSFAISREPIDRCLSMFFYLYWNSSGLFMSIEQSLKNTKLSLPMSTMSQKFDYFLELVKQARESQSIYQPIDNHFTTHTAPMWDDVTDLKGIILLKKIFRIENLVPGINGVFEECGINNRIEGCEKKLNKNLNRKLYSPSRKQLAEIREIYFHDFELYENS